MVTVLNFTALLIEHSYARHIYNSTEVSPTLHLLTADGDYLCSFVFLSVSTNIVVHIKE